jgi:LysR family transcriptional regulator, hydrogen peroxide-inducible genes activator
MEMHQIRYFLAVCSERNFTRAARLCHVSQPSLTRAIKLLEAEFGGFLFRREHANSHLTELGEIVRPHLQEVWTQSHAAIAQAHEFAAVSRSRLRIGIMSTIAPTLLANLLARMRRQRGIELQIIDGSASDLQDQLLGGQIAAAIYCKPEQRADARLSRIPMFHEQMQIALPRTHRLAGQSSIHLSDLAGESYVRRARCEFNELMGRLLGQQRISCDVSVSSERDDWALALIARGAGLALFPQHSIEHPEVVARPLAEPDLWREVHLVTLRERASSEALAFFLETAASAAKAQG